MDMILGMHIMEGFLPLDWVIVWYVLCLPFLFLGIRRLNTIIADDPKALLLIGFAGAFTFALSALKLPSVTGSCSHPTGIGLGAIILGPSLMVVIGLIVLLFQALLLAHGGITTLGANVFSMAVVGAFVAYGLYRGLLKLKLPRSVAVFTAACLGDLATYMMTALQLALAHPSQTGGFYLSWVKFTGIFAVTQVPIAVIEGILTVLVLDLVFKYSRSELESLQGQLMRRDAW